MTSPTPAEPPHLESAADPEVHDDVDVYRPPADEGVNGSNEPGKQGAPAMPSARRALVTAAIVTLVVTAVSWLAPKSVAATGVGIAFLGATWFLTVRPDESDARVWGVSLGGLLDREPIRWGRLARGAAIALLWAGALALVFFPPFYLGFLKFWHPRHAFAWKLPASIVDEVAGQLFVIALPEEAFFRGYLQSALEAAWTRKVRFLGADLGAGWLVSAAVFAVGHVLTAPSPARLAVFFPALLFGYLRARTKGIGAGVVFHAACNIYSAALGRGFGMAS